jgi:2-C-methyl-D-erythritol 4-phosphate cytidylyltransferase
VRDDIDFVAVHDAARCCVTSEWVDKCFRAAEKTGAAILACPVVDTIKKAKDGVIIQTVDRAGLYEAQTPQVFSAVMLKKAYANIGKIDKTRISDDSQLVEALGEKVSIVETDATNIKITKPGDVALAEAIIKELRKVVSKEPLGPFYEAQW